MNTETGNVAIERESEARGVVEMGSGNALDNIETENLTAQQQEALRIAKKILNVLATYPIISPTMLQMGIGPAIKPVVWKPVLEQLIVEGFVVRESRPVRTFAGGLRVATVLRLSDTSYHSPHEWKTQADSFAEGGGEGDLEEAIGK